MELKYFTELVLKRLPRYRYRRKNDKEAILNSIAQDHADGFSVDDCVRVTKYLEHYSPGISEERACAAIAEISRKYRTPKQLT